MRTYDPCVLLVQPELGQAIRTRREALGLSRRDLGEVVGYSARTIEAWEKAERSPRLGALRLLNGWVNGEHTESVPANSRSVNPQNGAKVSRKAKKGQGR